MSWACQRSSVRDEASRIRRSGVGSSLLSVLRIARSSQVRVGRGLVRRSTVGDLVSQDQDLGVFSGVGAGEQRQPGQHAYEHQVGESEGHGERSCWGSAGR
jgi:hypothetical protein